MSKSAPDNPGDERESLIAEIHAAFRDVNRDGGVSWSETIEIDNHGSESARQAARRSDRDRHWSELVNDDKWDPGPGGSIGGFVFLDPIGFRYYLPAAMIRCLRHLEDVGNVSCFLQSPDLNRPEDPVFDLQQCRCIARFLWYMAREMEPSDDWLIPLERHWQDFL